MRELRVSHLLLDNFPVLPNLEDQVLQLPLEGRFSNDDLFAVPHVEVSGPNKPQSVSVESQKLL